MGFFDIFSGGPFDFNGDGHTGSDEMAFGFMMIDDIQRKEKERKKQEFVDELLQNAAIEARRKSIEHRQRKGQPSPRAGANAL